MLTIKNHHRAKAPPFDAEDPNLRHYYFENSLGEQAVYVWDRKQRKAKVYLGDNDWEPANVRSGNAVGLELDADERLWLMACWISTARSPEG